MANILRLEQEPSGPRHHLDGRPVHAGDTLELAVAFGVAVTAPELALVSHVAWVRGRYEWSFEPGERPIFYLELGDGQGCGVCVGLAEFKLPEATVLRWPSE